MRPWAIFQGLIRWSISEHWKMIKSHYALINSILNIWIVSNLFPPTLLIQSPIQFGSWFFYEMQVLHCSDLMYNSKSICESHLYILYIPCSTRFCAISGRWWLRVFLLPRASSRVHQLWKSESAFYYIKSYFLFRPFISNCIFIYEIISEIS